MDPWSSSSWRGKPIEQVSDYADKAALAEVVPQLSGLPALAHAARRPRLELLSRAAYCGACGARCFRQQYFLA
jgi:3-deoxy-D-arabino-heptulosonate 7-phosphate (DAHP) synthase class II